MDDKTAAIVSAVLVANTPQLCLSILYFSINSILTSMSLASEWAHYGYDRATRDGSKSLRTSVPTGQQRSTFFLQLPYRFSIPLLTVSALVHWLISQSIFLAVITVYDEVGDLVQEFEYVNCGFSPFAMILVIVIGALMPVALVWLGYVPLDRGMRIVGSCSAAISAACHCYPQGDMSRDGRQKMVSGPLVWGDVTSSDTETYQSQSDDDGGDIDNRPGVAGHCCFVSAAVEDDWKSLVQTPVAGRRYA